MEGTLVLSGAIESFKYSSFQYGSEVLHRIKVVGPISLKERIPLYNLTLTVNTSSTYFCILDNTGGYENVLTFDDIKYLDKLIIESGISAFYGATVTKGEGYSSLVNLANANVHSLNLDGELVATDTVSKAEEFIFAKIKQLTN